MVGVIFRNKFKTDAKFLYYLADGVRNHTRVSYYEHSKSHMLDSLYRAQKPGNKPICNKMSRINILISKFYIDSKSNVEVCWSCSKPKSSTLFCSYCNSLQPLDKEKDFYELLGVPQTYEIQPSEIKMKYRDLQTLLHPDKFTNRPKREQAMSEEFSSEVNKAYSTLLDPLERGLYLLSRNDISIEEGSTQIDKVFLMEIMERNEDIENETDPIKLREFYSNNREQLEHLKSEVAQAFDSRNLELAKELLTKMKYYKSIEEKIKEIRQRLHIPD